VEVAVLGFAMLLFFASFLLVHWFFSDYAEGNGRRSRRHTGHHQGLPESRGTARQSSDEGASEPWRVQDVYREFVPGAPPHERPLKASTSVARPGNKRGEMTGVPRPVTAEELNEAFREWLR
jgi:hypothetical protein